ncbi:hypothetical protein RchiOBHm_Chr4g0418161 [Rosa chinensis]|uniref:Uncharacterized protein n=1 Tax=Rosa chinensis TaxID=74649 RepID=A0A2P6QXE6_ROSCH|nr:hypothetical protein RchiOBHm_Chr4g0418161 [Rosa chinensis]
MYTFQSNLFLLRNLCNSKINVRGTCAFNMGRLYVLSMLWGIYSWKKTYINCF